MTPDDQAGDQPTKPLPQDPGPTEPIIAPHVPVANLSTAPLDPVGAADPLARPGRSRAFMWALIAAVLVLGVLLIVVLTNFVGDPPAPAVTQTPSPTPTLTVTPSEGPPIDVPETPEDDEPEPAPTTPPEPTDPPDPEPTGTPAAAA
jgi:hypothetical protein